MISKTNPVCIIMITNAWSRSSRNGLAPNKERQCSYTSSHCLPMFFRPSDTTLCPLIFPLLHADGTTPSIIWKLFEASDRQHEIQEENLLQLYVRLPNSSLLAEISISVLLHWFSPALHIDPSVISDESSHETSIKLGHRLFVRLDHKEMYGGID